MSPTSFKMPTKYETLLLNHVFKTNLSKKKKHEGKLWHETEEEKKKKDSLHVQVCVMRLVLQIRF